VFVSWRSIAITLIDREIKEAFVLRTHFFAAATLVFLLSVARGQTGNSVVATINIQQAIFDSKEGRHELAAIHTKDPQERQQQVAQILQGILPKMAPVIVKFAEANELGIIIDTSMQLPSDPIFWTKQHGGNVLRKQVDITKQIVDSFDGSLKRLPLITGDQRVLAINLDRAIFNTDEGKRELAAIGNKVTPEQKETLSQIIRTKMTPVIDKVAGDSGADIVLDISKPWPGDPIVWVARQLDITDQVTIAYNGR